LSGKLGGKRGGVRKVGKKKENGTRKGGGGRPGLGISLTSIFVRRNSGVLKEKRGTEVTETGPKKKGNGEQECKGSKGP